MSDDGLRKLEREVLRDVAAWDVLKSERARAGRCPTCGAEMPCQACVVFDIAESLRNRGFRIHDHSDDRLMTATNGRLMVEVLRDEQQMLGCRASAFERWSISVEVEATVPYSEAELDAFLAKLESLPPRVDQDE